MWPHANVFIFSLLTVALLTGCATNGRKDAKVQAQVRERVEARWEAVISMNFDKVYTFATPAYRDTYDLNHYRNQYAGQIIRESIEMISVTIPEDDPDTAFVRLNLNFAATSVPSGRHEGQALVEETWVRRDGQWWFVEPR